MIGKQNILLIACCMISIISTYAASIDDNNSLKASENDTKLLSDYPWINTDFIQNIIEKELPNHRIHVQNFIGKDILGPGYSYEMFFLRIVANYRIDDDKTMYRKSFLMKVGFLKKPSEDEEMYRKKFDRELFIYEEIIKKIEKMLKKIGDNTKIAPRIIFANTNTVKQQYIIFEDFINEGYQILDRRFGFNIDQFKLIFEKLAKFHATTAVLHSENDPSTYNDILGRYSPGSYNSELFNLQSIIELSKTYPGYEAITEKLKNYGSSLITAQNEFFRLTNETFNTIIHADIWMPNVLFKYGQGNIVPSDVLLDRFGDMRNGPIVYDILYALFSSSHDNVEERDWDVLIQHYHSVLNDTLVKLNYSKKIPSLTELHMQCLLRGKGLVLRSIIDEAMNVADETTFETPKPFILETDTEQYRKYRFELLSNPNARKRIGMLFDYFDRKGFLEN